MKKIAILTSGGDAPGMNCAVRSVVRYGHHEGLIVIGVGCGFMGLIEKKFKNLGPRDVSNIISRGGTVLKTARCDAFFIKQYREIAYKNLCSDEIDGLIVIGGNGSFQGALLFHEEFAVPVVGIPATIDNDINGTQRTLGFDTALNTAMDAIDKIKDTSSSMDRIFLIEVMGRNSGSIAVHSALSGGAEDILIPGEKIEIKSLVKKIEEGRKTGKKSWIIIVAEGACLAKEIEKELKTYVTDIRATVIGHIQRGGSPSAFDRFLGALMGKKAVDALIQGKSLHAIGWVNDETVIYPLEEALKPKIEDFSSYVELIQILT